jgi:acyl-CoA thioester hydrolase
MSERAPAEKRDGYKWFTDITTRYYSYFDTAANLYLIREGGLDIAGSSAIGVVVESKCSYREPIAYPADVRAGLRVDKLGNRSVTYGIGIFSDKNDVAAASGTFVHVFVDRVSRRPVAIPEEIRKALEAIAV